MFVFQNKLTAISQYAYQLHSPRLLELRSQLTDRLLDFYNAHLQPKLSSANNGFETCAIDVAVAVAPCDDNKFQCKVIEINPFLPTTDGALFSWETERDLLEGARAGGVYPILRLNEKTRVGALVMIPRGGKRVMELVESTIDRCVGP